ncbi:hypothetical protein BT69DRAFT_1280465 [Atractiella rhizophila]|nr:hypothetical protein BT69DRAFT_1280465 [Atractiella rhizophila]
MTSAQLIQTISKPSTIYQHDLSHVRRLSLLFDRLFPLRLLRRFVELPHPVLQS